MYFLTEEEEYNAEYVKCEECKKKLSNNKKWIKTQYNYLKLNDIISVVYFTASQKDMYYYKPLVGIVINIVMEIGIIEKIIILDQNNNETNILKCGFGYGFSNVGFCDMSINILSELPEKKRKNEESIDILDTKINKEENDSLELSSSSDSDTMLVCEKIDNSNFDPYYISDSD